MTDTERLDWVEQTGAALVPVEGNIMPPGSWAVEPPDAATEDDVFMAPTLRAAIDAAARATGREVRDDG